MAQNHSNKFWLRDRRVELDLTAEQCAGLVGVSRQAWFNWERGLSWPRPAKIVILAELLKLSPRSCAASFAATRAASMYWGIRDKAEADSEKINQELGTADR